MAAQFDKTRARDEILFYVLQFCTAHHYGQGLPVGHGKCFFVGDSRDRPKAEVGDLLLLRAIRHKKWSLCWLLEIRTHESGEREYLCESVETGELCWWGNVSVEYLDRETVSSSPQWRWTDRQYKFWDRWNRVCYKDNDAYITLPTTPVFGDGNSVTLGTRTRYGFNDYRPTETFSDWRKVTKAMMSEFYQRCVAERPAARATG